MAGPMAVFITIGPGVTPAAARRSLDQVTAVLNRSSDPDGPVGGVVSVLRPAEIADYHAVGSTPSVLAAILAAGAIGALGLTLIASVRRRRREFALLKTLGFTPQAVLGLVLGEAVAISVVGGAIGYVISTFLMRGVAKSPFGGFLPPMANFSPAVAFTCVATAAAIGFLSSLVPALNASRISIVEALRSTD